MLDDPRLENYDTYIMAAYVKYIEASGARVVPLIEGENKEDTLFKLSHLNGVLFPGGGDGGEDFGELIFRQILEYNDEGNFYPAWGTCLGYEHMVMYTSDAGKDALGYFPMYYESVPIYFDKNP